jgi:hypothetical protein
MNTKLAVLVLLLALPAYAGTPAPPQEAGVSFGVFYSSLEPYGEWIQLEPDYYAWHPLQVARGWRPYFNGEWEWTPDGWYWASDEPWAWAVYHYGRWFYDDQYGWLWVPGYDWAPAWVEWRYSDAVIGWAPLGPYAVFGVGFGIRYYHSWVTPNSYWCFVGVKYMGAPYLYRHVFGAQYNRRYLGATRAVGGMRYENRRIFNLGPDRGFIEQHGGGRFRESRLVDVRNHSDQRVIRRGNENEIRVFRPRGSELGGDINRPARVREAERKPGLDFGSTDLVQRRGGQQGRQMGNARETSRGNPSPPRQEVRPRERVAPAERPAVRPAPGERSREQQRNPRNTQPGVKREARSRRDGGAGMFGRPSEQRMSQRVEPSPRMVQRERPVQRQAEVRPQQYRGTERSVRRSEPRRVERAQAQKAQRSEDRRGRGGR